MFQVNEKFQVSAQFLDAVSKMHIAFQNKPAIRVKCADPPSPAYRAMVKHMKKRMIPCNHSLIDNLVLKLACKGVVK